MREIKFRVWDNEVKEMANALMIWTNADNNNYGMQWVRRDGSITLSTTASKEGAVLMQFTGLKDKNGKDVFEGDIVRCSSGCPHEVEWRQELGGEFVGGMPGWYLSGLMSGNGKGYAWTGTEEIIGNRFENPELLQKERA